MRFGVLGPLDIRSCDGTPLDPGGPRPRALLTLLLLDAGRTVSAERLIDGLYGDDPRRARATPSSRRSPGCASASARTSRRLPAGTASPSPPTTSTSTASSA
ncbi:hypothetical protein [Streptomyces alfalfae]|uniref:hypothetical protein n=1 Tax=Streptomyces alfalfae TaxID=1642299 RepID=UPI002FCD023A